MNKVGRELPASVKCLQQRYSSKLMKSSDMATPTGYQYKPKKNVCVLSSLHMSVELGESKKKKPETVEFYDNTKCGVFLANQMARQYLFKADTCWWPVAVFYNILDLASINAFVLYKKRTGDRVSRRDFLFKLATELREDYIIEKLSRNANISRSHTLSTAPKKQNREA